MAMFHETQLRVQRIHRIKSRRSESAKSLKRWEKLQAQQAVKDTLKKAREDHRAVKAFEKLFKRLKWKENR